ncbi:Golgi-associated RAB2 interactor protein 2 isoform X2 [Neopsephotus bourkii]|uniref:Golgi-associated RAB2 interactor protein 2 isoform X2 n=1 Tax=Neopsephotus bourkii TaxID=309878 RepID=UPI002AA560E8|nr:Golgi-associated RAB2 interactor protein 2 isoform X2 [Neopsephotus bourkii]
MNSKFDLKTIRSSQASITGDLQKLLSQGEYVPFTSAPILESKFVQVNRRGEPISIHNQPSCVIIGICSANPTFLMPEVVLIACEVSMLPQDTMENFWKLSEPPFSVKQLALTRLFPLKFVELSVHSTINHHLMLKLVNGHSYYLELCAPPNHQQYLFHLWLQLISLLKPPEDISNTKVNVKSKDFDKCPKKVPRSNDPSEKRDDPQDVPNLKAEKKVVVQQISSSQVPLSGTVEPTEEGGIKAEIFNNHLEPARQEITMQSKNMNLSQDIKKSESSERRKTRTSTPKNKRDKKTQTPVIYFSAFPLISFPVHLF